MKAFVTDGDQRPALAITRSLARRGITVLVGEERGSSLASVSRSCAGHVTYPSPYTDAQAFVRFLPALIERERPDVIIPVTDVTTHLIARHRSDLRCATTAPPLGAFDLVSHKATLIDLARQAGIPTPRTHVVEDPAMLAAIAPELAYPLVVKSARSRILTGAGWVGTTAHHVADESELWSLYRQTGYLASYPSLIQERIVGPGLGVFVLFDRGRLVASFAHRRIREKPPAGGVSVMCEAVEVDPRLVEQAVALLGPLGWHGVAMLEYKQDRRIGTPVLIEVNGRFWGSLQLAVDAGVDFPYLSCQLALGAPVEPPSSYRAGVKSRWLLGDLDHLTARLLHSDRALRLPDDAPSRCGAVAAFMKFFAPDLRHDVERFDDPRPFLHEARAYVGDLVSSAARRAGALVAQPQRWRRGAPARLSDQPR